MQLHVLFSTFAIAKASKITLNKRERNIEIKTRKFRVQPTDQCELNFETAHWQPDSAIKNLVSYPPEFSAGRNIHYGTVNIKTDDFLETWNYNTQHPGFYASTVLKNFPEFCLGCHEKFKKLNLYGISWEPLTLDHQDEPKNLKSQNFAHSWSGWSQHEYNVKETEPNFNIFQKKSQPECYGLES